MFRKAMFIICILAVLTACTGKKATPTPTPLPPTNTPRATDTPLPSPSPLPPTNTPRATDTPLPSPSPYPTWTLAPTAIPYPVGRAVAHIIYNPKADQALMYGGMLATSMGTTTIEVWLFDPRSSKWQLAHTLPSECNFGDPAVYDSQADRVILYCGGTVGEVWEYDFNTDKWSDRKATNTPTGSSTARMAYDVESDKTILIGGVNFTTAELVPGTWAYDYTTNTWTKMKPKTEPPGLFAHVMDYDTESDRVILWGGYIWTGVNANGDWTGKAPENLVWAYDYNTDTWESLPVTNGPDYPRFTQIIQTIAAVYVPDIDRTIFYWDDQLWLYDYNHNAWEKAKGNILSGAGSREAHSIVYLPSIQRLLVFGGGTVGKDWTELSINDNAWLYDPRTGNWTQVGP